MCIVLTPVDKLLNNVNNDELFLQLLLFFIQLNKETSVKIWSSQKLISSWLGEWSKLRPIIETTHSVATQGSCATLNTIYL